VDDGALAGYETTAMGSERPADRAEPEAEHAQGLGFSDIALGDSVAEAAEEPEDDATPLPSFGEDGEEEGEFGTISFDAE
jgi:hypothetical protein